MEDQLADSFFGFDAALSGSPDEANDETEDGQDEEFYDALNEQTFGTDAVEGDWEQDHEKLAEITELARVRSNSYNGIEEKYNENGADCFAGGESDLADSISRMVFEDQDENVLSESKMVRNFPVDSFDGSYSSSAPSGFSLWSNSRMSKGQNQPLITVPAASGTIWDPNIMPPSLSQKESGSAISDMMNVRTVKDLECHLLHKGGTNGSHQSSPSHSAPSVDLPLPKPSAAWLLEDIERELTSTTAPILPLTQTSPSISFSTPHPIQRSLPHHIPRPYLPPPHSFIPGNLPPAMIPSQTPAPPMSIVDMAMRQMMQPSLAAMAQNQRLMAGTGGAAANMLLFLSKEGNQQRSDKGFVDTMRSVERPRGPPNHMHQGIQNFTHPLHRVDFGRHQGFPQGHVGQMPRFPHPPFPIPGQQMHHRGFFGGRQNNMPGGMPQFHHPQQSFLQQKLQHQHQNQLNGSEEWDEYSGLMTQWEKQFLLNIQRMQLQSDRPYVDDYYYMMYMRRKRERSKEGKVQQSQHSVLNMLLERERNMREKDSRRTEHHKYTPAQFENSLGKLQVVSVMAPRKIIDLDMTPPEKMEIGSQLTARDSRRIKLEIERLYQFLLQIEDLDVPFIDKQDLTTTESKEELLAKMLHSLQQEEKLSAVLCFRKGKMLLVRLLSHLAPVMQTQLWSSLLKSLGSVIRKDSADSCLPLLTPHFQKWVSSAGPTELSLAASALLPPSSISHSRSPSPLVSSKSHLATILGNKFGISVMASMVERIADLQSRGALNEGDRTCESSSKYALWVRFMDCVSDAAATVPEVATSLKMSMLGQNLLSSPSPLMPSLPEGETTPLERLAALSKALHRLDEEVVVAPKCKVSTDS